MSDKHYYQVVSPKCNSILHSASPSGAAAKAYTHCVRTSSKKTQRRSHVIKVQQRSRSGEKKVMSYRVREVKQPKNFTVERAGMDIPFAFRVKVKSLNKKKH